MVEKDSYRFDQEKIIDENGLEDLMIKIGAVKIP
jgi:hypothetical protein